MVGFTVKAPAVAIAPLNAPAGLCEAVQAVAFVLDHVSVDGWPAVMEAGLTPTVTVGAGGGDAVVTTSVAVALAGPPLPVHCKA